MNTEIGPLAHSAFSAINQLVCPISLYSQYILLILYNSNYLFCSTMYFTLWCWDIFASTFNTFQENNNYVYYQPSAMEVRAHYLQRLMDSKIKKESDDYFMNFAFFTHIFYLLWKIGEHLELWSAQDTRLWINSWSRNYLVVFVLSSSSFLWFAAILY